MAFLAGDLLTAQRANRLQPARYDQQSTGNLAASSTQVDVPGATITFDTETDGAEVQVVWVTDFDLTGATTTAGSSSVLLDSVTRSDTFALLQQGISTDRATVSQAWTYTIPTAGSHTIKIQGTTPANMVINQYTYLMLTVYEVV